MNLLFFQRKLIDLKLVFKGGAEKPGGSKKEEPDYEPLAPVMIGVEGGKTMTLGAKLKEMRKETMPAEDPLAVGQEVVEGATKAAGMDNAISKLAAAKEWVMGGKTEGTVANEVETQKPPQKKPTKRKKG